MSKPKVLGSDFVKQVREEMPGYTYETLQYVVDTYDRLDQDGSGTIDNAEIGGLLSGLGVEATDAQIAAFVQECDTNRDGTVERMEFVRVLYRRKLAAARRKCWGEKRVWMMEHPAQVKCATRTMSTCIGLVSLFVTIYGFAVFSTAVGSIEGMLETWELVPITNVEWVTPPTGCSAGYVAWQGFPIAPGEPDKCDCSADCSKTTTSGQCSMLKLQEGCKTVESSCSTTTNGQGDKVTTCVYDCNCANRDCISVGACNSTSTRNCNTILGYPETELKKWRGKHLCFQRGSESVAKREESFVPPNTCTGSNSNSCNAPSDWFSTTSTIGCFPSADPCPLTQVTKASNSPFDTSEVRTVSTALPLTAFQSGTRASTVTTYSSALEKSRRPEAFLPDDFTAFDTQTWEDVYVDNGVPAGHGGTANVFGMGYQSEIAWDNKCRANREDLIDMAPSLDKLKTMLTVQLVFIIIDFIWSLIESYTIASSKELKWLSLRTACDIGCYGATLPIIIIAMSAAGVVSAVTNDVAKCAATPALRDDFERISSKAATVAGTNLALLIFKGIKMLFMSALVQYGIWRCMRWMCGKKRTKGTMELALADVDMPSVSKENPMTV